jgi:pyridoxine 5-phosphate synthase
LAHDAAAAAREWKRIVEGARLAKSLGLEVHAGHGLDFQSAETIAALPQVVELNIGHFLIGEAAFVGLAAAIGTMREAMRRGRARAAVA